MRSHRYQIGPELGRVSQDLLGRIALGHPLTMRYQSLPRKLCVYQSKRPLGLKPLLDVSLSLFFGINPGLFGRETLRFLYVYEVDFGAFGVD
jgi:hypothetical protein